ncbi:MAG: phosphoribosyltransferase family protein [Candidatus Roizmanbacteria bacterium]|nr:phosphoribosyltransferase family protein [Candidatus Roizmanbacteria bacterium]
MHFYAVSWETLHMLAFRLAKKVKEKGPYDYIVAISRGGLSIGHMLTDFLDLPILILNLSSYTHYTNKQEVRLLESFAADIANKRILLVDDVSDTGDSFIKAMDIVRDRKPLTIVSASVFVKPNTHFRPDFHCEETTKWIVFPSEIRETVQGFKHLFKENALTKKQLQKVGIHEQFIQEYIDIK